MKHKSSLLLMEQLIMLLVFALAAVLCLQIFIKADTLSRETEGQDRAVVLAQNAAALLKASGGDIARAEALGSDGYEVEITFLPAASGLEAVQIQVFYEGAPLFALDTGWQEANP